MPEHPNNELAHRGYAAGAAGDLAAVGEILDEHIVWHMPGHNPLSGDYIGKPARGRRVPPDPGDERRHAPRAGA